MLLNCGIGADSWESLGLQGDPTSPSYRKSLLNIHWKDWCWSWSSSTLATWCKELTHWKRPWYWERLKAGREGDDRGQDGWMVSPIGWTWVWASSGKCWWTWRPGMLQSMGLQRVRQDWATEQQQVIANLVILEGRFYYLHFIDVKNILENNGAVFVDNMYVYIHIYTHAHRIFFTKWHICQTFQKTFGANRFKK